MKIGIFTNLFQDKSLEEVAQYVSSLGYQMVELPAWEGNPHLDIEKVLKGDHSVKNILKKYNLDISALNCGIPGQLVLGPHDESTDEFAPLSDPKEKIKYAITMMKKAAQAASELEIPVICGFVGSHVWDKWYIFPPKNEELYEKGWEVFAERWGDILDFFKKYGVKFAFEVHPNEIAYNIETAQRAIQILEYRDNFGFNFDPSHLVWQLIDPVVFIKTFKERIFHAHAKDAEIQEDEVKRSGVIPTGSWMRLDRGFRFRVPGWGDVKWKKVMSALLSVGYNYVLSFEHEDPVMSREDGCEKAIEFLKPLIIKAPLLKVWW